MAWTAGRETDRVDAARRHLPANVANIRRATLGAVWLLRNVLDRVFERLQFLLAKVLAQGGLKLTSEVKVRPVELRCADELEVALEDARQRQVGNDLVTVGVNLEADLGF